MPHLLKGAQIVEDLWLYVDEETPLPSDKPVCVSYARFVAGRAPLLARRAPVGVALPNTEDPAVIADALAVLAMIALAFPAFRDGRAFSQARLLREHYGFTGELRARGDILPDQYFFLLRCGFDAVEIPDDADLKVWRAAAAAFSFWYQPAAGLPGATIRERRREALKLDPKPPFHYARS